MLLCPPGGGARHSCSHTTGGCQTHGHTQHRDVRLEDEDTGCVSRPVSAIGPHLKAPQMFLSIIASWSWLPSPLIVYLSWEICPLHGPQLRAMARSVDSGARLTGV